MKNKTFVFRVDSSKEIGSGHLMRCLTLARSLRNEGAVCSFICRALEGNLNYLVESEGFFIQELPLHNNYAKPTNIEITHSDWLGVDWKIDAKETSIIISDLKPNWLIIDHYSLWENWEKSIIKNNNTKIMVIDDLADRKHHCHLLLDQNLGSNEALYKGLVPKACKKIFGPQYALLRSEFHENRSVSLEKRNQGKLKKILINFGGGDPLNYIGKILKNLSNVELSKNFEISVIFGGLSQAKDEHWNLLSKFKNKVMFHDVVKNMAEFLVNTDIVIGAAGSSSWERCCLGVPSIVFPLALNQIRIAEQLSNSGAVISLEENDISNNKLADELKNIMQGDNLKKMSIKASSLCDGLGVDRIMHELRS